jgi:general secretion pathway protein D
MHSWSSWLLIFFLVQAAGSPRAYAAAQSSSGSAASTVDQDQTKEKKSSHARKPPLTAEEIKKRREDYQRLRAGKNPLPSAKENTASDKTTGAENPSTGGGQPGQPSPVSEAGLPDAAPATGEAPQEQSGEAVAPEKKAPPQKPSPRTSGNQPIKLDYDNADLYDFINVVADLLEINYIIDPGVQGKVTIKMTKPVPSDALFPIFIDILRINGVTIVKSGDIYHIVPIQEGQKYPSETIQKVQSDFQITGSDLSTFVIPIEYMPSGDLAKLLEQFQTDKTQIINLESHNILVITDFKDNVKKLFNIIQILDNGYFDVNRIELVQIKFNKADEVVKDLEAVFGAGGATSGVKFIPIERLNSILVVCRSARVLESVYEWVNKLDRQAIHGVETFVYKVENTTAFSIAEILAQLFSDQGAQTSSVGSAATGGVATGERGTSSLPPTSPQQQQSNLNPQLRGTLQGSGVGPIQGLSGNVKIIVDELNNNIIIQGTQADYEFLLRTIKKLDVLPRQVLIEAKIINVELSDGFNFGVQANLVGRSDAYPPTTVTSDFTGSEGSAASGITFATLGIIGNRELNLIINTLETKGRAQVLNAPSVMVLDGNEASINVGAEIPVATSTFTNPYLSGGGNVEDGTGTNITNTQIQYRSTGITLNVAPRISSAGIVTLEVAVEVSSPGASGEGLAGSPPINRAVVNSTMIVEDGASIVIAGLIREEDTKSRSSVPLLGRIPLLGWLFGSTSTSKTRQELLVLLTPHVIHTTYTAQETSDAVIDSLKQINKFIENKREKGEFSIFDRHSINKNQKNEEK